MIRSVRIKTMKHDDSTNDPYEEPMSDSEILDEIGYILVPALDEAREQGVPEVHIQNAFRRTIDRGSWGDPLAQVKFFRRQLHHLTDEYTIPDEE